MTFCFHPLIRSSFEAFCLARASRAYFHGLTKASEREIRLSALASALINSNALSTYLAHTFMRLTSRFLRYYRKDFARQIRYARARVPIVILLGK